jgi:riboflavin kinase/FMN adenylyltransferase
MRVFHGSDKARGKLKGCVVTLGVFDGVHLGHQKLLKECRQMARKRHLAAVVYTFEPHPVKVVSPEGCPPLLMTQKQKLDMLKSLRLDAVVVEPFTKRFSHLSPEAFLEKILIQRLAANEIFVGYDFTFGAQRGGTTAQLVEMGKQSGIAVHIMKAFFSDEYLISSTAIRQKVQEGDMARAARLLGRPYGIEGTVVKGDGLGRQLGFPTANLRTENELLPHNGVYAAYCYVKGRRYHAITNIGVRPTFQGHDLRIESHILHFKRRLIRSRLRIEFLSRLRAEIRFQSPEELIEQIHKDVEMAENFFQEYKS